MGWFGSRHVEPIEAVEPAPEQLVTGDQLQEPQSASAPPDLSDVTDFDLYREVTSRPWEMFPKETLHHIVVRLEARVSELEARAGAADAKYAEALAVISKFMASSGAAHWRAELAEQESTLAVAY